MPPKRRAIAQRGLAAHEQLRAVATRRRSRIPLTGIGDMPLECLACYIREPAEERLGGRGQGEGRDEATGLIEGDGIPAEEDRLLGVETIGVSAAGWREAASARPHSRFEEQGTSRSAHHAVHNSHLLAGREGDAVSLDNPAVEECKPRSGAAGDRQAPLGRPLFDLAFGDLKIISGFRCRGQRRQTLAHPGRPFPLSRRERA